MLGIGILSDASYDKRLEDALACFRSAARQGHLPSQQGAVAILLRDLASLSPEERQSRIAEARAYLSDASATVDADSNASPYIKRLLSKWTRFANALH